MAKIQLDKVKVDEQGRVIIEDAELAKTVSEAKKDPNKAKALGDILCNIPCL